MRGFQDGEVALLDCQGSWDQLGYKTHLRSGCRDQKKGSKGRTETDPLERAQLYLGSLPRYFSLFHLGAWKESESPIQGSSQGPKQGIPTMPGKNAVSSCQRSAI